MAGKTGNSATFRVTGESLAGIELFSGLSIDARNGIAELCDGVLFAAGEVVVGHLSNSRKVFFLVGGTVEVSIFSVQGRRVTFHDKGPGQMFGELAAIDGKPRSAHVIATEDCHAAAMSAENFLKVAADYDSVNRQILEGFAWQVRVLSERVFEFSSLCVNKRIHIELLRRARAVEATGNRRLISPAPIQADIASRVSSHREAVSREMSRLVHEGLLEKTEDGLIVTDIQALETIVEESMGDISVIF